jgi:hypothetical protein
MIRKNKIGHGQGYRPVIYGHVLFFYEYNSYHLN